MNSQNVYNLIKDEPKIIKCFDGISTIRRDNEEVLFPSNGITVKVGKQRLTTHNNNSDFYFHDFPIPSKVEKLLYSLWNRPLTTYGFGWFTTYRGHHEAISMISYMWALSLRSRHLYYTLEEGDVVTLTPEAVTNLLVCASLPNIKYGIISRISTPTTYLVKFYSSAYCKIFELDTKELLLIKKASKDVNKQITKDCSNNGNTQTNPDIQADSGIFSGGEAASIFGGQDYRGAVEGFWAHIGSQKINRRRREPYKEASINFSDSICLNSREEGTDTRKETGADDTGRDILFPIQ